MVKHQRGQSTSEPTSVKRREIEPESPVSSPDRQPLQAKLWADLEKSLQKFTSHYSQSGFMPPAQAEVELDHIKTLIRVEGEQIRTRITNSWSNSDEEVFLLEMELVVNTITCALVNSRKTEWDTVRFADKAKTQGSPNLAKKQRRINPLDIIFMLLTSKI
ncbi:hypothetical protein BJV77DRAFT_968327 [Russula vinacea]|nr:hypothetical protein BJV77DRAFT_968327 [Russula vinacea]